MFYYFSNVLISRKEEFVSGGEDGVVNTWDLREKQVVSKIEPHLNDKIARPGIGKWIGAVNLSDDWLVSCLKHI